MPAYARLLTYWRDDYVPHANPVLAAEQQPDGIAYYRSKIAEFTTLDLSARADPRDRARRGRRDPRARCSA